jgi:hypothetical protein
MRQDRLRTILALIVIIAVSMWVGMLIERARRPTSMGNHTFFVIPDSFETPGVMAGPTLPAGSGEAAKGMTGEGRGGHDTTWPTTHRLHASGPEYTL